jgi:hypothetical protein
MPKAVQLPSKMVTGDRVTRCVSQKIAQNEAQSFFGQS